MIPFLSILTKVIIFISLIIAIFLDNFLSYCYSIAMLDVELLDKAYILWVYTLESQILI